MSTLPPKGVVLKQGTHGLKAWHKRWFVLDGTILRWYELGGWFASPLGKQRGEVDLVGGIVAPVDRERAGRECAARIVAGGRVLYFATPTAAELSAWLLALTSATGGGGGAGSSALPMYLAKLQQAQGAGAGGGAASEHSQWLVAQGRQADEAAAAQAASAAAAAASASGGGGLRSALSRVFSMRAGAAAGSDAPAVGGGSISAGAGGGAGWRGSVSVPAVSLEALHESFVAGSRSGASGDVLPDAIDTDGPPEVGAEQRVRGAHLERLCIAWFRLPGSGPLPDLATDVSSAPGYRAIPGATAQTYTVVAGDVGFRVGCAVRPAVGGGGRWTVQAASVVAVDLGQPSARLRLVPHTHSKYCDRRVRVCTAEGRYREGEVLELLPRGPAAAAPAEEGVTPRGGDARGPALSPQWTAMWYRSPELGLRGSPASSVRDLEFVRCDARPVGDLPPAPPDHAPAPTVAEIKARLQPRGAPAPAPPGGATQYPLFADDVGRMLVAALVPRGVAPPHVVHVRDAEGFGSGGGGAPLALTLPVGPIEPAPPRAREIWIEGPPRVGALLVGHVYYYGGAERHSVVSWVAIGDDGEAREVKPPTLCRPPAEHPLPPLDAWAGGGDAAAAHPRALRLLPEHAGCLIKFRVQPVRSDGDEGHLESSRPTREVEAAVT